MSSYNRIAADIDSYLHMAGVYIPVFTFTLAPSVGGVEGLVLFLTCLGGRYSVLSHTCHSPGGFVTTAGVGGGRV